MPTEYRWCSRGLINSVPASDVHAEMPGEVAAFVPQTHVSIIFEASTWQMQQLLVRERVASAPGTPRQAGTQAGRVLMPSCTLLNGNSLLGWWDAPGESLVLLAAEEDPPVPASDKFGGDRG